MARKGYASEYLAKKQLQREHGKENVIKVAIGGAQDYIVLERGRVVGFVEVKECHEEKYYPREREREQFKRVERLAKEHEATFSIWIHYPKHKKWVYKPVV